MPAENGDWGWCLRSRRRRTIREHVNERSVLGSYHRGRRRVRRRQRGQLDHPPDVTTAAAASELQAQTGEDRARRRRGQRARVAKPEKRYPVRLEEGAEGLVFLVEQVLHRREQ